ncbi:MAG: sulfatase activating formylglycine-generating enzyme [Candidatus Latescibacterota bacterium]|jgi:formylglycine-generating enzyme required for sulfatase activity
MIYFCRLGMYFVLFQCVMLFLSCHKDASLNEPAVNTPGRVSGEPNVVSLPPDRPEVIHFPLPTGVPVEMVAVSAGGFWMGSDLVETEEKPQRLVLLDGFYIDRYEVTVADYQQCVDVGGCDSPALGEDCNWQVGGRSDHPVNCVSWYDASRFCNWAGKQLPTEAQWEKAARGTDGRPFPWGNAAPDCEHAVTGWASLGCGAQGTWPVGSLPAGASPYGALDMIGNVWEWVADAYEVDYYTRASLLNPVNTADEPYRVLRGNSWYYSCPKLVSRTSNRYRFKPARWYPYIGFRCVMSDIALPVSNGMPTEGLPNNWIERNVVARELDGEPPFDTTPREAEMILIPEGTFIRGSEQGDSDEVPVRTIYQKAFSIDKFEVTVAQYRACVETGKCVQPEKFWGAQHTYEEDLCNGRRTDRDNHPINCMRWWEADQYCKWAGKRLPTEAEWEKAARGTDGRRFPWGSEQANCERAAIDDGGDGCGRESTWPVGSFPNGVSPYGVMDMSGNVWEWVSDWYGNDYYTRAPGQNPHNDTPNALESAPPKVLRGGSWADQTEMIHRTANRVQYNPNTNPDYTIGFRCAKDGE